MSHQGYVYPGDPSSSSNVYKPKRKIAAMAVSHDPPAISKPPLAVSESSQAVLESSKSRKPRKPRKKQAVKPTTRAATKAIVQKNVSESTLLGAPTEVRDSILRCVLGDRLIHIKYWREGECEAIHEKQCVKTIPASGGLSSAFCMAERSEQEAYDEANLSPEDVPITEDQDHIETCKDRHKNCIMCGDMQKKIVVSKVQAERLTFASDLSVLAACRLLYEESNNVLWQTNTFSFDDSVSFLKFCSSMNPSQKHKLKKVHISVPMAIDWDSSRAELCAGWARAITPRALTPLKNLKTIHLSFDQYCHFTNPAYAVHAISNDESQVAVKGITDTMLGLRALPWMNKHDANRGKHVTVIIGDDGSAKLGISTPPWTKAQKLATAETLRAQLAAPDSAEIQATAKAVEKATKEAERQKVYEDNKKKRTDDVAKARAMFQEARAEQVRCRLDGDPSKSAYEKVAKDRNRAKIYCELWKTLDTAKARLARFLAPSIAKSSGTKKDPKTK